MSIDRSRNSIDRSVRSNYNQNTIDKGIKIPAGLYRGIVVNNEDPLGMGRVRVQIAAFYGSIEPGLDAGTNIDDQDPFLGAVWCRVLLPTTSGTSQAGTDGGQVAYGINGPRPKKDNEVMVAFSGDSASGTVIGVFPDQSKIGNTAAGPTVGPTNTGEVTLRTEVAKTATSTADLPPPHPLASRIKEQGLDKDRIRGLNFSSVNRDPEPRVLGIATPQGHSLTMDDGDLEDGSFLGVRMRSAGGNQILMDDTNGFVYIINANGSSWIEMNRNGDIDIYTKQSLNIGTPGNINMTCGGQFNVNAGGGINMQANGGGIKLAAMSGGFDIYSGDNLNMQADANGNLLVAGNYRETAGRIDMNGPEASAATKPTVNQLAGNKNQTQSIAQRVPEAEPWAGHLDVSVLDTGSASGAASISESQTYYYGTPSQPVGYNDQTGQFDLNNFPEVNAPPGSLVQFAPNVDRKFDRRLLTLVENVAKRFGRPLTITSGFRSPNYNAKVGGARRSQHMLGKAVDISGSGLSNQDRINLVGIASALGAVGIGVYRGGSLHFDIRDGARSGWGSDYTRSSVPSYAVAAIDKHVAGGFGSTPVYASPNPGEVDLSQFTPQQQAEIQQLESDPAWSSQLDSMEAKYNLDRTELYQIMRGESSFNPQAVNTTTGASGYFQFMPDTARELGYSTSQIRQMSPAQQLQVYDQYLSRWNYSGSNSLGIMQAAPAYASRTGNDVVYEVGSAAWRQNPGWQSAGGGPVTVESINNYYRGLA